MTQFKCGNCQEIHNITHKTRFCPTCGSTSLNLVVKEQAESMSKETIGVYTSVVEQDSRVATVQNIETVAYDVEEERPRPRSKRS